jgi:hypothetical protein
MYVGKWRITEMEQGDKGYIDMVMPGHLTIGDGGVGSHQFGAVGAELDSRVESMGGVEQIEVSFEGEDGGDPVCGQVWTRVTGRTTTWKDLLPYGRRFGFHGFERVER